MFTDKSRYAKVDTITTKTLDGKEVTAIKRRTLPVVSGSLYTVQQKDRLDLLAYQKYKQPEKFWHIADANTELEAGKLVEEPNETIIVPDK